MRRIPNNIVEPTRVVPAARPRRHGPQSPLSHLANMGTLETGARPMNWRAVGIVATAVAAALVVTCGGRLGGQLPGTLEDGGIFRAPDGAIVFSPGSACQGYDASGWSQHLSCAVDDGSNCRAWGEALGPPHLPVAGGCVTSDTDAATSCELTYSVATEPCDYATPAGDAFCAAWATQFLRGGALGQHRCHRVCTYLDPLSGKRRLDARGEQCWSGGKGTWQGSCFPTQNTPVAEYECNMRCTSRAPLCVLRDGGLRCETPCDVQ